MSDLDRIDFAILGELRNDARISNKELAARVGLAPSSCLTRVRRLVADGVLRGFHADCDPAALGIRLQAMIAVRLDSHDRAVVEALRAELLQLPEVLAVFHVAGAVDFLVHVGVRDSEHLRDLAFDALTTHRAVRHVETSLIFGHERGFAALADRLRAPTGTP